MFVNTDQDLPNKSPETGQNEQRSNTRTEKSCLTVTNIPANVFTSDKVKVVRLRSIIYFISQRYFLQRYQHISLCAFKEVFEEMFKQYGDIMSIIYLKSFSRARVIYHNENDASRAKDELHGSTMEENQLGIYFTQVCLCWL